MDQPRTLAVRLFEPRCKVCRHTERDQIDLSLVRHEPYSRISGMFDVPYRSLANHCQMHLDREDPVIRRAVEGEEAAYARIQETGIRLSVERRLMLDFCIRLYFEALVSDKVKVVSGR